MKTKFYKLASFTDSVALFAFAAIACLMVLTAIIPQILCVTQYIIMALVIIMCVATCITAAYNTIYICQTHTIDELCSDSLN